MSKSKKSGGSAQGTEPQVNNKKIATSTNEVKHKCPISYHVILYQYQVGNRSKPQRAGVRERIFNDPNPFLARQEAFIYAFGLEHITNEQQHWGGLVFDSPIQAQKKRYKNYNKYSLEIWMNNNLDPEKSIPIHSVKNKNASINVYDLDCEIRLLESLGYTTNNVATFTDDNEVEVYRMVNPYLDLIQFDETEINQSLITKTNNYANK